MTQAAKPKMEDDNDHQYGSAHHAICDVRGNRRGGFDRPLPVSGRYSHIAGTSKPAAALFLLALLMGVIVYGGRASARDYGLVAMNFDLWCQEDARLPVQRCDQRTAIDEKAFEDFLHEISPFEAQILRKVQREQWLERDFMENDPIDNPVGSDLAGIEERTTAFSKR
jgi:hypothetical protein